MQEFDQLLQNRRIAYDFIFSLQRNRRYLESKSTSHATLFNHLESGRSWDECACG